MANGKVVVHKMSDDTKEFIKELAKEICDAVRYAPDDNEKVAEAINRIADSIENGESGSVSEGS